MCVCVINICISVRCITPIWYVVCVWYVMRYTFITLIHVLVLWVLEWYDLRKSWLLVPVTVTWENVPIKYRLGDKQPCPDSPKKKQHSPPKQRKKHQLLLQRVLFHLFPANFHHLRPSHASCSLQRASVHPSHVPCTNAWNDYHCHLRYDFVLVTSFGRHVGWWRDHPGDGRNDSDLLIQSRKKKRNTWTNIKSVRREISGNLKIQSSSQGSGAEFVW